MKKLGLYAMLISIPFLLLAVSWQSGRFAALASEARRLEAAQESWVQENEKIEAGIRVLSSKERIEALAERLGLQKAAPDQRLRVVIDPGKSSHD
jgi:hypothetical protein